MNGEYEQELARLCGYTHGRNAKLLSLAHLGRKAGRSALQVMEDIICAGGEPRLTNDEVSRAVNKAFSVNLSSKTLNFTKRTPKSASKINDKRQNWVRSMIEAGGGRASSKDLQALSKGGSFLDKVLEPEELYFFGDPYTKRTREHLYTVEQLKAMGENLPTHFIPNPFTGKPAKNDKGEDSWCLETTLAAKRLALIEFDNLELELQAAFWKGVIKEKMLPVVSLIYSGGKSIHGLIRLKLTDWEGQWRDIEVLMASDPDQRFRCDVSCKNAGRMTRVPDVMRPDTNRRQTLLYLA